MPANRPQRQLCDSTGSLIPRKPDTIMSAVGAAIFNPRGEILMEKRSDNGFWGMPGGAVDVGESVAEAVVREVLEETGLTVAVKRLIGVYSDPRGYNIASYPNVIAHIVSLLFLCETLGGKLRISEESTDIGYFPVDSLPDSTLLSHIPRIRDATSGSTAAFIR